MKNESLLKQTIALSLALAAVGAWAEPSGDRPDATHAWAVHDVNRPDPAKITVPAGGIPSDAIILFDGTPGSISNNWCSKDGSASKWIVKDGEFICTPGSGSAVTREKFADCQLHIEWKTPLNDVEGWGNSGVILMGAYEIQILDSSAIVPSNRMIASDGMPPAGTVIFTGSGRFTSWTAQACVASGRSPEGSAHAPTAANASKTTRICFRIDSFFIG